MALSQSTLRQGLLEDLDSYVAGTVTTKDSTTVFKAAALMYLGANEKVGQWVYVSSGGATPATLRESRKITAFDTSDGKITVATGFTEALEVNDTFIISPWTGDEIERVLNKAMLRSGLKLVGEDTSTTTTANTYSYTVPAGIQAYNLREVQISSTPSTLYLPLAGWKRRGNTLYFYRSQTAGKTLKLIYSYDYTALSTDASTWDISSEQAELIYGWAAVELLRLLYHRASGDLRAAVAERLLEARSVAQERQALYSEAGDTIIGRTMMP